MMLSKKDIFKELGKELALFPLNPENIKENSINVSVSDYAWTQEGGTVYWYGGSEFHIENSKGKALRSHTFQKGHKSVFIIKNHGKEDKKYLILFPHQTTIIETLEVIGIGNRLGGMVHSKVGVVAQGIGDTGTMLGPGYCGHLMISLHNITNDIVTLEVGTTFVSLTFEYLKTAVKRESSTSSSHYDKLLELKLQLDSSADGDYFKQDWKTTFSGVNTKMLESAPYKELRKKYPDNLWFQIKEHICLRNVLLILGAAIVLVGMFFGAKYLDKDLTEKVWMDRYFNVVIVAIAGVLFKIYGSLFRK